MAIDVAKKSAIFKVLTYKLEGKKSEVRARSGLNFWTKHLDLPADFPVGKCLDLRIFGTEINLLLTKVPQNSRKWIRGRERECVDLTKQSTRVQPISAFSAQAGQQ